MGYVHFDLTNSWCLGGMVPQLLPTGAYDSRSLPANMAAAPATYIIVNQATPASANRYAGITDNLRTRFTSRFQAVLEMGLDATVMGSIYAVWGRTLVRNTAPAVAAWPVPADPTWAAPAAVNAALIDGTNINLEQLLIRFILTQLGAGGTLSNQQLAFVPYANPAGNPITVRLSWPTFGAFDANSHQSVWAPGAAW